MVSGLEYSHVVLIVGYDLQLFKVNLGKVLMLPTELYDSF